MTRILVACEFSGVVRDAFINEGHDAMSCDFLPTEREGPHYQGNVYDVINDGWDLMIAHPPCTYLANSGVRWLHERPERWKDLNKAALFFADLLYADIPHIAVENPIPHKYAVKRIGRKYDQIIQPWQFGHDASKATRLWLKNLPPLKSTNVIKKDRYANQTPSGQNKLPPSEERSKLRSITYNGIAEAMAKQWGKVIG